ncbi:temperature associated repressor [Meredithblackwellia eburnea MCA 4105]
MAPTSTTSIILLAGATGRQGSAVLRALLDHPSPPAKIYALTRNTSSESAKSLLSLSPTIALLMGSPDSPPSPTELSALAITAAYLVTGKYSNTSDEVAAGSCFLEAISESGIPHLVFSSVVASRGSGVKHFETKLDLEDLIRSRTNGPTWTFVKPSMFMDNFKKEPSLVSGLILGLFDASLQGKKVQLVATMDIGYIAAKALIDPQQYKNRSIAIAGDELSMSDIQVAYGAGRGTRVWKAYIPSLLLGLLPVEMRELMSYMTSGRDRIDIMELRQEFHDLLTFTEWLAL